VRGRRARRLADPGRRAAKADEAAIAVDQGHAGKAEAAAPAVAKLGQLSFEAALLGEGGEDGKLAFLFLDQLEQTGELAADQFGRGLARRGGGGRREEGEAEAGIALPKPVGRGAEEVGLALAFAGWGLAARRPLVPAGDGERDPVPLRSRPDPEVEVDLAVGGEGRARDGDGEPAGEPGQGRDLRDRDRPADFAAGTALKRRQPRIGLDQPPFGIDPAVDGAAAHAASLATAAR
jgi:hypothetical protein